ncbi:hypothetical protein Ptr902_03979 [Pyrenophora tritici-repentis]|uniref:Uncharacterized protein n=1 Tax=Pyrenophora tritici-repentis TaxID=45151 RepID=A0A2W1DKR4_9PLEO|nr:hypothetical protein A1F99_078940 [Pyrenophora tritici-repentis]KAI0582469.1 hypothetical protein Alg215_04095 [Pyrenophora tritici-repentis]KAI0583454.1 hypothetical protein Alg130_05671 [Pyrenophora tritici-repentis]KAI0610333.1 hypothetical protein TUN205_05442 [Pyrenophora tritici-repentis]KAI0622294.1 hypothetical protein TUN199_05736 [Pyrenophora tritici-repentis]
MTSSNNTIPPDVAAVRKHRMNGDLINAFKRHVPPGTTPYVTGIGLYTHVEGPPSPEVFLHPQPEFLPLFPAPPPSQRTPLSPEIQSVWEELCEVMHEEKQIIGQMELSLVELRKRYEGLDVPEGSHAPTRGGETRVRGLVRQDSTTIGNEKGLVRRRSSGLVSSLTTGMQDVSMTGTEERRRKLPQGTKIYAPDPRKQGR